MKYTYVLVLTLMMAFQGNALAGDVSKGKAKATVCASCHGNNGVSGVPNYPNLAGQKEQYLAKAITDYKTGARSDPTMKAMVANLSEEDIKNLAAYFSSLSCK